jgi:hypothetical protein
MNEVILALLGFGLGILATIITQFITRRIQFSDSKKKQRLERLQKIRQWMEAYKLLLACQYPEMAEFAFGFEISFDETAPVRLLTALKEYREAEKNYNVAEKIGHEAMLLLAQPSRFDGIKYFFHRIRRLDLEIFMYPSGFPRSIAPYLKILSEQKYRIFKRFPEKVARAINWKKLDYITAAQVESIIYRRLKIGNQGLSGETRDYEKEIELGEARDNLSYYKSNAEQAIDNIIAIINQYEEKWFYPQ